MASPIVEVKEGVGSFVSTTGGVDVTNGSTISIRLQTPGPVTTWYLQVLGVDEVTATPPSLTDVNGLTHQVTTPNTVVTFTMPAGVGVGRAIIIRSWVDAGGPGEFTTFGIYALLPMGVRVGAVGERLEGDPVFGWVVKFNTLLRNGTPPTGPAGGDLGGSYPDPDVTAVYGTLVGTQGGSLTTGYILTVTGPAAADWLPPPVSFTAGGDLSGTNTSQTVEKVKGTIIGTAAGSLVTGRVLTVTGPSSADWSAINTGGDVSGLLTSQTVEKIKNTTIATAGGSLTTGHVLTVTGPSTADWQPPPSGFTAGGDLSGTPTSQTVEKIKGTAITTAGGSLPTGYVLKTTGTATADWVADVSEIAPTVITQAGFASPYVVTATDRRVHVSTTTTAYQVNLPSSPTAGRRVSVKDKAKTASIRPITINGNGNNIDGATTTIIAVDGANVDLIYDGSEWAII